MATDTPRADALALRYSDDKAESWPAFPFLPLIRPTGKESPDDLELGVIIAGHGDTVVLSNMVDLMSHALGIEDVDSPGLAERLAAADKVEYPDFDAVLDDGWNVD